MRTRMAVMLAALTLFAGSCLISSAHDARADGTCVGYASPSTSIHMASLTSVNGGRWETLFGQPYLATRYVQTVLLFGYWDEVWIGNQLYLIPSNRRVTEFYGC